MDLTVAKMTKVVRFDKNTPVASGAGWIDSYSILLTTRGYLKKLSGTKDLSTGEILTEKSYELFVRFQQTLETNLRADLKIIIDNRVFSPKNWDKIEEKRFYHHLIITEVGRT